MNKRDIRQETHIASVWTTPDGLRFEIDPELSVPGAIPKQEGWNIIGELEFQDPVLNARTEDQRVLAYRTVIPHVTCCRYWYGLGTWYGISDYNVCCRTEYLPILDMIKDLVGLNDEGIVDEWHGSTLFKFKLKSTRCRFVGQQGWFDML